MKERLLVLAKAAPETSRKYEQTICVAGITETGEWRRIYPVPWEAFWKGKTTRFSKKTWIEYDLKSDKPSDHRPESRKIRFETIKPGEPAPFKDIESLLKERLECIDRIQEKGARVQSMGVVQPVKVYDFAPVSNEHYEELVSRKAQKDLMGNPVIRLEIPKYKYQYFFEDNAAGKRHELLCEDWEVGELYRHCEEYRKAGRYKDENEVHEKVRQKMLCEIFKNGHVYFVVGSHYRFNTYMIIGVIYPKKSDW